MRESSLVPTNLLNWPVVAALPFEPKMIILSLWSAGFLSTVGCGEFPLRPFAASLGIEPDLVIIGIKKLADENLIFFDTATSEIFILDWFRFHKFKNRLNVKIGRDEIQKIRSKKLAEILIEKFEACLQKNINK
jgi:hypothetical protein